MPPINARRVEARIPPHWISGAAPHAAARIAKPSLAQFVLLSVLLHALFIMLFGSPAGSSREGRALWGTLDVTLQGPMFDSRIDVGRLRAQSPPQDLQAVPEVDLSVAPPLPVPRPMPPAAIEPVPIPFVEPVVRPAPEPVAPPVPATPRATSATVPPALVPPVAQPPLEMPLVPAPSLARPRIELPVVTAPLIQHAYQPAAAATLAPPVELAPAERRAERPAAAAPVPSADRPGPATQPVPSQAKDAAPSRAAPARDSPIFDTRKPPAAEIPAPGTGPRIDLDAARARAREIAREGTGNRALLPFPMPPAPERKTKEQLAIEKAWKPDCKDAYKDLGLLAVVPLIANEFGEGSCRW